MVLRLGTLLTAAFFLVGCAALTVQLSEDMAPQISTEVAVQVGTEVAVRVREAIAEYTSVTAALPTAHRRQRADIL